MNNPIVSVIIPAYNCSQYIEKTIESVLQQNVPLEIILIDDCSKDNLVKVLEKYRKLDNFIYLRNEKNLGVAKSRNRGVQVAKGEYIAYLDADDWWVKDKLEKQLNIIKSGKYALCYTGRELVNSDGSKKGKVIQAKELVDYGSLLYHNCISCSSVMLSTNIAREIPMSNDEFHEDYINWLRILKKYGQAYGINEPLLMYRQSETGKSRNRLKSAKMTYGVYRMMDKGRINSLGLLLSHLLHGILKYK